MNKTIKSLLTSLMFTPALLMAGPPGPLGDSAKPQLSEGFENLSINVPQAAGEGFTAWRSCIEGKDGGGKVEIVAGSGRGASKGLRLGPSGEEGLSVWTSTVFPAPAKQEISFWIKKEGDLSLRMNVYIRDLAQKPAVTVGTFIISYGNAGGSGAQMVLPSDAKEWIQVVITLDQAASSMKATAMGSTVDFAMGEWPLPTNEKYGMTIGVEYKNKSKSREPVILDDFTCNPL